VLEVAEALPRIGHGHPVRGMSGRKSRPLVYPCTQASRARQTENGGGTLGRLPGCSLPGGPPDDCLILASGLRSRLLPRLRSLPFAVAIGSISGVATSRKLHTNSTSVPLRTVLVVVDYYRLVVPTAKRTLCPSLSVRNALIATAVAVPVFLRTEFAVFAAASFLTRCQSSPRPWFSSGEPDLRW
jgi:hypothetical protein